MKLFSSFLSCYLAGIVLCFLMIETMYVIDYFRFGFVKYSTPENEIVSSLVCGIPFGIAIFSFCKLIFKSK